MLCNASSYFVADPGACSEFRRSLAQRRHVPVVVGRHITPWWDLLPCNWRRRLLKYDTQIKTGPAWADRWVIADAMQEPDFAGAAHDKIPTLLRGSCLYAWPSSIGPWAGRPLLPTGYFLVQALPAHLRWHRDFKHMSRALQCSTFRANVGDAQVKQLAGNGMNAAQVGVALLFATCSARWPVDPDMVT